MSTLPEPTDNGSFLARLRSAGIEPGDSAELRLNKSLLMLATGLISITSMLWLLIYWVLGPQLSSTLPFVFQLLLTANMLLYVKTRSFNFFRITQTGLFLFMPFIVQWSIGSFISASGIVLWGLLAPVGAILFFGVREAAAWFFAWVFMVALSGMFDFLLADAASGTYQVVPIRTSVVFFALNFIAVSTIIFMLLRHSFQKRAEIQARFDEAHQLLEIEQEKAERLLLNILPEPVATRLKHSDQIIADGFADVTVMFADIVNFTQVAANMAPNQVFAMLNRIFSAFDDLAGEYHLEKIKTIGDAYMVAGGINQESTDYSAAIADMAVAMRELLHRDFAINSAHLEIRIGIGTGPVVGGVLGKRKFIYDLWGDTVNIASRITAEGVPGMIQCDTVTYHRLQQKFDFHEPQTIYLKGKGNMTVYRLIGRSQPVQAEALPGGDN